LRDEIDVIDCGPGEKSGKDTRILAITVSLARGSGASRSPGYSAGQAARAWAGRNGMGIARRISEEFFEEDGIRMGAYTYIIYPEG